MGGAKGILKRGLGEMGFNMGGGAINWFPGHMAAATRAIRNRLKVSDLVIEVHDARIPLSSKNEDLQPMLTGKRRIIALNKKDLANPNIMHKWRDYFESCKQDCLPISAHSRSSVQKEWSTGLQLCLTKKSGLTCQSQQIVGSDQKVMGKLDRMLCEKRSVAVMDRKNIWKIHFTIRKSSLLLACYMNLKYPPQYFLVRFIFFGFLDYYL